MNILQSLDNLLESWVRPRTPYEADPLMCPAPPNRNPAKVESVNVEIIIVQLQDEYASR